MRFLKIDITFDSDYHNENAEVLPHMGIQCCNFIKERMEQYPMGLIECQVLALKKFLALRELNSPYHGKIISFINIVGGLSSYAVILLLLAFLNSDPLQILTPEAPSWALIPPSRIFLQFLNYYGNLFNTGITQINHHALLVPKQTQPCTSHPMHATSQ